MTNDRDDTQTAPDDPHRATLTGVILEDEKVMGTIHIAFGDNKSMGGGVRVASHLDGLVKSPSVWFDDDLVMDGGRLLND